MPTSSNPEFRLEVVTPYRVFYSDMADMVVLQNPDGQMGVMKGHVPLVTLVEPGQIKIRRKGEWHVAAIGEGYVEITRNNVYVVADSAEWPDEIDQARALAAKERAEERLRKKISRQEYIQSKSAISRALARLSVKKERH